MHVVTGQVPVQGVYSLSGQGNNETKVIQTMDAEASGKNLEDQELFGD